MGCTEYRTFKRSATLGLIEFNALKDAGASDLTGICIVLVVLPIRKEYGLVCLAICVRLLDIWLRTRMWSRLGLWLLRLKLLLL